MKLKTLFISLLFFGLIPTSSFAKTDCSKLAARTALVAAGDPDQNYFSVAENKVLALTELQDYLDGEPSKFYTVNFVVLSADNDTQGWLIASRIEGNTCKVVSTSLLGSQ